MIALIIGNSVVMFLLGVRLGKKKILNQIKAVEVEIELNEEFEQCLS
ncbi:MAG: hypothetical protein ACOC2U_04080 [bacterium]